MKRKIISVIMLSALVLSGCKNTVIQDSAQGSETDNYSIFTQPATPDEVTIEIVNATECSNEVYYKSLTCSLEGGEGIYNFLCQRHQGAGLCGIHEPQ